jgi:hypothetical protein
VWTGLLSIQLFVGALMPLACLLMLNNADMLVSIHGLLFGIAAIVYLRHAFQVMRWSFG